MTGHSVLGERPERLRRTALQALFRGKPIRRLPAVPAGSSPARRARHRRTRLAQLPPAHGYPGLAGRTARAVELTIADLARQLALSLEANGSAEDIFCSRSIYKPAACARAGRGCAAAA